MLRKPYSMFLVPCSLFLVLCFLSLSSARAAPTLTLRATVGFAGQYKLGEWVPVRVEVRNDGAGLDGEVQVDGVTENGLRTLYTRPVSLPARSNKALFLYTLYTGFVRDVEVRLVQGRDTVAQTIATAEPLGDGTYLVGVVAEEPYPATALAAIAPPSNRRGVRLARLALEELPPRGPALRSLDAIILGNVATASLSREQRAALAGWVEMGGQLIVAPGPSWQKTLDGLADLPPVQVAGVRTLDRLPGLERWVGTPLRGGGPFVVAAATAGAGAQVLAEQDGLPLLVERRRGSGRVDFLALDVALEPLNGWAGSAELWRKLLVASTSSITPEARIRRGNPTGGPPVTAALSNIPAMDLPSARWLGAFLGAYILCVGPLNYLLLRRLDRREWAWLTVPLLTLLFSVGAYAIGFRAKGGDVIVSTVAIERVHADGQPASVESYFGLFSPSRRTYDVDLGADALVSVLPNAYGPWGGPGNPSPFKVQQGDATVLRDVSVDMWSMRAFMVEQPRAADAPPVRAALHTEGDRIVGTITNAASQPLVDAALVHGNDVTRLGTLPAGEERVVSFALAGPADPQRDPWLPIGMRVLGDEPFRGQGAPPPPDRDRLRRQNLLEYVFGYGKGGPPEMLSASGGLQLVAWRADDPLQLEVRTLTMARTSTVLLLADLPVSFGEREIVVPPGFMARSVVETNARNFNTTPFGFFLGDGSVTFQFQLPAGTERMQVEELALHFSTMNRGMGVGGQSAFEGTVYDWRQKSWVGLKGLEAGKSHRLENPARFVDESGAVRLKLALATGGGPPSEINRLDFAARGRR